MALTSPVLCDESRFGSSELSGFKEKGNYIWIKKRKVLGFKTNTNYGLKWGKNLELGGV
jgi:hypothetical protein